MAFELDYAAIGVILRSPEVRAAITELANQVVANLNAEGEPVVIRQYTTDRAAVAVSIESPKGLLMQVEDGVLTKAAAAVGLQIKEKPSQ